MTFSQVATFEADCFPDLRNNTAMAMTIATAPLLRNSLCLPLTLQLKASYERNKRLSAFNILFAASPRITIYLVSK